MIVTLAARAAISIAASAPSEFPPRLVAGKNGVIYAWSDNRQESFRFDERGLVKLRQPVAFVGFGVNEMASRTELLWHM